MFEMEAAGQRHARVESSVYLGGTIDGIGNVTRRTNRRISQAWKSFVKYGKAMYNSCIDLAEKICSRSAKMIEVMLYGCATWTLSPKRSDPLREAHRVFLLGASMSIP